jgi:methionine-S-sulfoxide reductase
LKEEGYEKYLPLFQKASKEGSKSSSQSDDKIANQTSVAILAGGCFWGVEEILRSFPGVIETSVGYTGGLTQNPIYQEVKKGSTGHAEAIRVVFDPKKVTYEEILGHFFRLHDPTTLNRQGNDIGTQYRSAIFYSDEEQHQAALRVKEKIQKSGKWKKDIVTEIVKASDFYPAEEYHQDYLQKNPGGYTCHYLRD